MTLTSAVVLCTYNGERFLRPQLESLLAQTRRPDLIVARDDASSDGTFEILQAFRSEAEQAGVRVELHRNERNLGYVRNFERALGDARADVLFLCDQDDIWFPPKIERMLAEFERRPGLLMLHTDANLVDAESRALGLTLFDSIRVRADERRAVRAGRELDVLLRRNIVTGATAAIRSVVLQNACPFPGEWVHDEWLGLVAAIVGETGFLEETLIGYRQHGNNAIGVPVEGVPRAHLVRRAFLAAKERRMAALYARIEDGQLHADAPRAALIRARLVHARMRAALPSAFLPRLMTVGKEALTGRYWTCSSGLRSLAADVLALP